MCELFVLDVGRGAKLSVGRKRTMKVHAPPGRHVDRHHVLRGGVALVEVSFNVDLVDRNRKKGAPPFFFLLFLPFFFLGSRRGSTCVGGSLIALKLAEEFIWLVSSIHSGV